MINSLLVRAFQQLSPKELRSVQDFMQCSLFNRREEVSRLCAHIAAHIGKPAQKAFAAERLFAAAFPGETYDNRKLRHTMSYALDAFRQYLALTDWQSDKEAMQQHLVRALRQREMEKLFDKALEKAETQVEKESLRDARHHYHQYLLHQEKLESAARTARTAKLNLQPLPDELTHFYVAEMLRHACSALMHQAVASQTYQLDLLDAILDVTENSDMLQIPAVSIYYQAYRMLQSPEEDEPFLQLKSLLMQHEQRFSQQEMRGLYLMAINGCIRRMNSGKRQYIQEAFNLYKAALERNFLTENGYLSSFTFKNIVRIGAALGEHDWTGYFVETQQALLHPRERENTYRYNRAFLYFQQQDYAQAFPLLQQVELEDPLNNLHARRMLLRSYVELGEQGALESLIHSFSAYLNRQKQLGYHRDLNINFLRFVHKMMILPPGDKQAAQALAREIEQAQHVAEKEWLLAKLAAGATR